MIDSGIDYTHEDLNNGRVRTDMDKDYVNKDDDAMDDAGHGTHVAGTIAAASNNGIGVSGILWQAQLLPLKVCDASGSCSLDAIVSAIQYAADKGARLISMSLGGSGCSSTWKRRLTMRILRKGWCSSPPPVITTGWSRLSRRLRTGHCRRHARSARPAYFSNYGDSESRRPWRAHLSTVPNNGYDTFSGTSMATPQM